MEDKPLLWLVNSLASTHSTIPLLDCYLVENDKPVAFYSQKDIAQFTSSVENGRIDEILSKIYREHSLLYRLRLTSELACYFFVGNSKHEVTGEQLELLLSSTGIPEGISLIQIPKSNPSDQDQTYRIRVESTGRVLFEVRRRTSQETCKDKSLYKQALNIAKAVTELVKETEKRKTLIVDLELLKSGDKALWVSNVIELKVQTNKEAKKAEPTRQLKSKTQKQHTSTTEPKKLYLKKEVGLKKTSTRPITATEASSKTETPRASDASTHKSILKKTGEAKPHRTASNARAKTMKTTPLRLRNLSSKDLGPTAKTMISPTSDMQRTISCRIVPCSRTISKKPARNRLIARALNRMTQDKESLA